MAHPARCALGLLMERTWPGLALAAASLGALSSGCALAVGRIDLQTDGRTLSSTSCAQQGESKPVTGKEWVKSPDGRSVYTDVTRMQRPCEKVGETSSFDTGETSFGVSTGIKAGYASIGTPLANVGGYAYQGNVSGLAWDLFFDASYRRPGRWSVGIEAGNFWVSAEEQEGAKSKFGGYYLGLRGGVALGPIQLYSGLHRMWSELELDARSSGSTDMPVWRIPLGVNTRLPLSDSFDLVPRLEVRRYQSTPGAEASVGGWDGMGALTVQF